jgi:universal stress protein E
MATCWLPFYRGQQLPEFPMTRPIRRILVAVKEVGGRASPTLRKAAGLAKSMGARLELFHAMSEPLAVDILTLSNHSSERLEADEKRRCLKRLEALAAPLRRGGLAVDTAADWDHPAHEAVIRQARRTRADLIVAERHASGHVAPWILRYTDWELLRQSPVPVLLVKKSGQYKTPKVLAAIDPAHAFAKTGRLDEVILRLGASICAATRGRLHAVHTYVPSLVDMAPETLSAPDATAQITTHATRLAEARFDKTLRRARLGKLRPGQRHLLISHAVDAIPMLARKLGCDLVVMGALSRSGLKRFAIGNTAERLLDDLPCDLLIVKPPGFATRIPSRSRGPQLIVAGPVPGSF